MEGKHSNSHQLERDFWSLVIVQKKWLEQPSTWLRKRDVIRTVRKSSSTEGIAPSIPRLFRLVLGYYIHVSYDDNLSLRVVHISERRVEKRVRH